MKPIRRWHEVIVVILITIISVSILLAHVTTNLEESEPWPIQESLTLQYQNGMIVQSSSNRVEISIIQTSNNITFIRTDIELPFSIPIYSKGVNFTMTNIYLTWGSNYAINESKVASISSESDDQKWQSSFEESRGFGAVTLEFEGEYIQNESSHFEYNFRLSWNSTLTLDNFSNDTSNFSVLMDFSLNLVKLFPFSFPLLNLPQSSLWFAVIGAEGIIGLSLVLLRIQKQQFHYNKDENDPLPNKQVE